MSRRLIAAVAVALVLAGCSGARPEPEPTVEPTPSEEASTSPSRTPIEAQVPTDSYPALQPIEGAGSTTWQITGADALNAQLQQRAADLAGEGRTVSVTPISASPRLVGFRERVTEPSGRALESHTSWFSVPDGAPVDAASFLIPGNDQPPGESLSFTTSGDLYWESPNRRGWGGESAPWQSALTQTGLMARAGALHPLDPVPSRPTPDCKVARCVAVTFDDGPGVGTAGLLATLAANGARATFFANGVNIPGQEDTLWAMVGAGNQLGNHNQTHVRLSPLADSEVQAQIAATDLLIAPMLTGSKVFRPPYGDYDEAVRRIASDLGYSVVMWNLDPLDYRTTDTDLISDRVLSSVRSGSIILAHDTQAHTELAYRSIIPALRQEGYELVTVDELLGPGAPGAVRGGYG